MGSDERQAIELKPDLILLDIEMPKLDGLSACRLIRKRVPTSNTLILTMYQSLEAMAAQQAECVSRALTLSC